MTKTLASVKDFIYTHRAKIAAGMTAIAFLTLMYKNSRELEKFMAEHDLLDKYHAWLTDDM